MGVFSRSHSRGLIAAFSVLVLLACIAGIYLLTDETETRHQGDRPPSEEGRLLFNGDVSTGDLSQYQDRVQHCDADRTTVVEDPLGVQGHVIRFHVLDTDVAPCTPSDNPRAQVLSPDILREGEEYWIGWSVLIPDEFPVTAPNGDNWIALGSTYGPPHEGSSGNGISFDASSDRGRFYWRRNETYGFDEPWSMPLVRGRWVDFVIHTGMSKEEGPGFREQWVNAGSGWVRSSLDGKARLSTATLTDANNDGPNVSKISLYYRKGIMEEATVYFANHKIGTSFDAVAPDTYGDD